MLSKLLSFDKLSCPQIWNIEKKRKQARAQRSWNFLSLSRTEKMYFSIGIYSRPVDPIDSIGTNFYPLIQHGWDFSKSLTNRKSTFPLESICVQWITYAWQDFTPVDFWFSDGKQGDTTEFQSTVLVNPRRKLDMFILFQKCQFVYPNKVNSLPIRHFPSFSIFGHVTCHMTIIKR